MSEYKGVINGLENFTSGGCVVFASKVCDIERKNYKSCSECMRACSMTILEAMSKEYLAGKSAGLPECVQMPRFDTGELVQFGDAFEHGEVCAIELQTAFYALVNEMGDRFLYRYGVSVKHPEPEDTQERLQNEIEAYMLRLGEGRQAWKVQDFAKRAYILGRKEAGKEC